VEHGFASVCVLPHYVLQASDLLSESRVNVCTVVGFPLGGTFTYAKLAETGMALVDGATEIDMVMNIPALINGDFATVESDIHSVVELCHKHSAITKVIVETCLLNEKQKIEICKIVTNAGADFIKTSTGFSIGGATVEDIKLMKKHVGENVRIKASGGIRTLDFAIDLIGAGATRIGASAGVQIVNEAKDIK
jgi:deoxyribose-phosphate aldolase